MRREKNQKKPAKKGQCKRGRLKANATVLCRQVLSGPESPQSSMNLLIITGGERKRVFSVVCFFDFGKFAFSFPPFFIRQFLDFCWNTFFHEKNPRYGPDFPLRPRIISVISAFFLVNRIIQNYFYATCKKFSLEGPNFLSALQQLTPTKPPRATVHRFRPWGASTGARRAGRLVARLSGGGLAHCGPPDAGRVTRWVHPPPTLRRLCPRDPPLLPCRPIAMSGHFSTYKNHVFECKIEVIINTYY